MDESVAGKLYKEKAMNELNAPISGGGMQPSQQIQVAPQMQAPPQQAAPAVDIDAIRKRYQSGYRQ
jgi:hypothetical protein